MMLTSLSRRSLIGLVASAALWRGTSRAMAELFVDTSGLSNGRFVWQPRLSLSGPLLVLVSLTEQSVHVFRGSERIGISTCRIANAANLPSGIFQLTDLRTGPMGDLDGRRSWRAAVTFAEGLAQTAAGQALPIRLPRDFSRLLQEAARGGATIAISPRRSIPVEVTSTLGADPASIPDLVRRVSRGAETAEAMGEEAHVVVSAATRTATLVVAGRAQVSADVVISEPERPLGTHLFSALGPTADQSSLRWLAVALSQKPDAAHLKDRAAAAALARVEIAACRERDAILAAIGPRSAVLLTDAAAGASTRLAAPGLELFSDGAAPSAPRVAESPQRKRGRAARRGYARTADGTSEPAEPPPSAISLPF